MQAKAKARILVVGGAGYVGSATCAWLLDHGHEVWILDDLSTGHACFVEALGIGASRFVQARAGDRDRVLPLLEREPFDCVMHFAARSLVAESVEKPREYFENNVEQTRALLGMMAETGTRRFIFSSTCAIFGDPGANDIHEDLPKKPLNPYGETKLEAERVMEEFTREQDLQIVALRYFNAAGAEPGGRVGEWHAIETHLIPRIFDAALAGRPVEVYGTDYPTPDGTCVRDYIHVTDLAAAHEAAMLRLLDPARGAEGRFEVFNLGSEKGYSVREIIRACERATGIPLQFIEKPRRAGDPPRLVASSKRAAAELGFTIAHPLDSILASAWGWERKRRGFLKKAVFLDRDGTLNHDPGYLSHPDQLELLPGAGEALSALKKAGYLLIVVSNQSGVGRGLIDPAAIPRIHARLLELLKPWGIEIDHFELCFHRPDEDCDCRKPKSKLVLDAAAKLGVDVSASFMVGDKLSDLGTGRAAGCRGSILVRTGEGRKQEAGLQAGQASFTADSLLEAARWILAQGSGAL
ncbi:MAG: UDP-glucose 4-epimerase GalE [Oligoflexia bacterium]|nr:UDP-glucose 4-epimerase GalE [Oligoflexia bacterium]